MKILKYLVSPINLECAINIAVMQAIRTERRAAVKCDGRVSVDGPLIARNSVRAASGNAIRRALAAGRERSDRQRFTAILRLQLSECWDLLSYLPHYLYIRLLLINITKRKEFGWYYECITKSIKYSIEIDIEIIDIS